MNPSQEPAARQFEQPPAQYEPAGQFDPVPVYPYGPPPEALPWEPVRRSRRSLGRTLLVALSVTVAMSAVGAPLGLLWSWLAPSVPVLNTGQDILVNDPSPEEYIAADGWFTLIGFGFGLVAAVIVWLVLRRDRGPALLLGVTFGGLGAALAMWGAGRLVGLSAWQDWQESSKAGDTFGRPPDLRSHGALLVVAFAAVIVTTLLAGWSNDPDLERPGARPGYGHDLPPAEPGADPASSGSPDAPDPTGAPVPPAPWPADPPRG